MAIHPPGVIGTFLFENAGDVLNTICRRILQQDVDMILIDFHSFDIPMMTIRRLKDQLFYISTEVANK